MKKDLINSAAKKYSLPIKVGAALIVIGGGVFAAVKITRKIKQNKLKREREGLLNKETADANDYITGRSLSDASCQNVAEQLYVAMDGIGTDEDTIKRLLITDNITNADLIKINEYFGIREYGSFGSPYFGKGDNLDLRGWLKKELGESSTLFELIVSKFNTAGLKM